MLASQSERCAIGLSHLGFPILTFPSRHALQTLTPYNASLTPRLTAAHVRLLFLEEADRNGRPVCGKWRNNETQAASALYCRGRVTHLHHSTTSAAAHPSGHQ
jgi:hypothetical protein